MPTLRSIPTHLLLSLVYFTLLLEVLHKLLQPLHVYTDSLYVESSQSQLPVTPVTVTTLHYPGLENSRYTILG